MNIKSFVLVLALSATIISAACPGTVNIKTFSATDSSNTGKDVSASVTSGYKLIGGGFSGYVPLTKSYPSSSTTWTINAHAITASVGPGPVTAYAIGLYDPDNCWTVQQIATSPSSQGSETGTASAECPYGTTLVGGGATTDRYLSANYPDTVRGSATGANRWTASFNSASSSFVGVSSTGLSVYALCLKPTGSSYSAGNFINNAAGTTSTNIYQIVGGGYRVNGQYATATSSYNHSGVWESLSGQQQQDNVQSISIGLSISSSAPTSTDTTATTGSSPKKSCVGQIVTTPRSSGGSWTSGNTQYQIYDISVKNLGDCPITRATYDSIFTGPNTPGVSQKWNIGDSSSSQILGAELNFFGDSIPSGSSKEGFGVVAFNATGVTFVAKGPTTFCDASCTNA